MFASCEHHTSERGECQLRQSEGLSRAEQAASAPRAFRPGEGVVGEEGGHAKILSDVDKYKQIVLTKPDKVV
jgi:hypothetical protein